MNECYNGDQVQVLLVASIQSRKMALAINAEIASSCPDGLNYTTVEYIQKYHEMLKKMQEKA